MQIRSVVWPMTLWAGLVAAAVAQTPNRLPAGANPGPPKSALIIAEVPVPYSLQELVSKSEVIALGTVEKCIARERPGSDTIETDVFVSVSEIIKGAAGVPKKKLIAEQLGGTLGDRVLDSSAENPARPGETYLLFLAQDRRPLVSTLPVAADARRFWLVSDWNCVFKFRDGKVDPDRRAPGFIQQRKGAAIREVLAAVRAELESN